MRERKKENVDLRNQENEKRILGELMQYFQGTAEGQEFN